MGLVDASTGRCAVGLVATVRVGGVCVRDEEWRELYSGRKGFFFKDSGGRVMMIVVESGFDGSKFDLWMIKDQPAGRDGRPRSSWA